MKPRPLPALPRQRALVALALFLIGNLAPAQSARAAEHVVIVVFDGLRPDSIVETDMPNLFRLKQEGSFFAHHHPVYPSSTEVNGSAIATGGYPVHTGIMANNEYRPEIELMKPVGTESESAVRRGDRLSSGRYLLLPTVAEIVQAAGRRTAVAGTKPIALLIDRAERTDKKSALFYGGKTLPADLLSSPADAGNSFPARADDRKSPNAAQDRFTTQVLIDRLWSDGVPAYSLLWLSDPDYSQHGVGPGAPMAREALHNSDEALGKVLRALERFGAAGSTDVLVVSDHGFSMIARNFDLAEKLSAAGFHAARKFTDAPRPGDVVVVGNSGTACLYVVGKDPALIDRLVSFCQKSDFAGVVLAREPHPGAFTLAQAAIDTPAAPDVVVSMRWTDDVGHGELPGQIVSESLKLGPGQGNHSTLSRFDMHNTLVASGPDFRARFVDELPSGNADVAPTVLHLLGLTPPQPLDGRILTEALRGENPPAEAARTQTLHAERAFDGEPAWKQYLQVTRLGAHLYLDEGNIEK